MVSINQSGEFAGENCARVCATLTPRQRQLVMSIVRQSGAPTALQRVPPPGSGRNVWWQRWGLSENAWRDQVLGIPPGAVPALSTAMLMDHYYLMGPVLIELETFTQEQPSHRQVWTPDCAKVKDAESAGTTPVSVRGGLSIVAFNSNGELVRFALLDFPLGDSIVPSHDGQDYLAALLTSVEEALSPGTPLTALGIAKLPMLIRTTASITALDGTPLKTHHIDLDAIPDLRHRVERSGWRALSRLVPERTNLLADLAPVERDRWGRLRTAPGPRVLLTDGVTRKLLNREYPNLDRHRIGLDDHAYDCRSYFGVYPSGFGLAGQHGQFEPVAVAVYQQLRPIAMLISGWDLRSAVAKQELAAAVHFASSPNEREVIKNCRRQARSTVDALLPQFREPRANAIAAEIEQVFYAQQRLQEMARATVR